MSLAPHTAFRFLCVYLAAAGLLWTWFGHTVADDAFVTPIAAAPIAMAAGIAMRHDRGDQLAAARPRQPDRLASRGGSFWPIPRSFPAGVAILSLVLVAYSIAGARSFIATGRKRLALEAQARKAQHFVDEFENSGRGWFWETDRSGTLSYVSQQLADDFQCEPEELLGRQFTDLLSVDTALGDSVEERKTLGFHLSARFPFSDVVVRPASEQDVHWSLSGNPIFDERGRFLGFRGIGTDLTEQRRSEQEITPPRPLRLADRPAQPGDDAPDARRGAAQCGASAEGLRAVPDRSRPLQERQRHARPSDRRRACCARSPTG